MKRRGGGKGGHVSTPAYSGSGEGRRRSVKEGRTSKGTRTWLSERQTEKKRTRRIGERDSRLSGECRRQRGEGGLCPKSFLTNGLEVFLLGSASFVSRRDVQRIGCSSSVGWMLLHRKSSTHASFSCFFFERAWPYIMTRAHVLLSKCRV